MERRRTDAREAVKHRSNRERLSETSVHDWYRMVYAYSDRLVEDLVEGWGVTSEDLLLDPFVGTGTTCLAAKTLGIDSIGTDAMPPSVLASRVKTRWDVDVEAFERRAAELLETVEPVFRAIDADGTATPDRDDRDVDLAAYDTAEPEKVPAGWLSETPRRKMLVLKREVDALPDDEITDLLRLATIAIMPEDVANVGFGPEAYRLAERADVDVHGHLSDKLETMAADLRRIRAEANDGLSPGDTEVFEADARTVGDTLRERSALLEAHGAVDYVITSPPYPAEHDYTRNQRLELVWLDEVTDDASLQRIKKNSIRSNTKNIYVGDDDGERTSVRDNPTVDSIVAEMERILEEEDITHGFGQYYPRVVEEYFGGMVRHFRQLHDVVAPGGLAGYVVADQASYWQVDIPTGEILGELAEEKAGFAVEGIDLWRTVAATTGQGEDLREEILVLRKPE